MRKLKTTSSFLPHMITVGTEMLLNSGLKSVSNLSKPSVTRFFKTIWNLEKFFLEVYMLKFTYF